MYEDELTTYVRSTLEQYMHDTNNYSVLREADAVARAERLGQYRVSWKDWNEGAKSGGGTCLCMGPIQLFPSDCYMTDDCLVHGKSPNAEN